MLRSPKKRPQILVKLFPGTTALYLGMHVYNYSICVSLLQASILSRDSYVNVLYAPTDLHAQGHMSKLSFANCQHEHMHVGRMCM
jgi:hypothetical protein